MPAPQRDPKAFTRWFRLDYFRRPRSLRRLYSPVLAAVLVLTGAVAAAGVAFVVRKAPGPRAAFQAAPVSTPHALFADRCEVCHDEGRAFMTALRLWPGAAHASSVSDQACLQCHPAGGHNPRSPHFVNADTGQSKNCTQCHREHRGDAALSRLPDAFCTQCHADLQVKDGKPCFYANIRRFDADHPDFGAWRKGGLTDPGTVHFSHKAHLDLATGFAHIPPERVEATWAKANIREARKIDEQGCAYCHKMDEAGRYMRPIRYQDHCAACHPLLPQLQPGAWPEDVESGFTQTPLHHPGRGEDAAAVRGELLERFSRLPTPNLPPAGDDELRPFFLNRPVPPLGDGKRRALGAGIAADAALFSPDAQKAAVLPGFEGLVNFNVNVGCAYCHEEAPGRGQDDLPVYKFPQLLDRWFPHARFDHRAHRMMKCADCHAEAEASTDNKDVLLPKIGNCRQCHGAAGGKARSDCLECHTYHGRGGETPAQADPPAVDAILKPTH
jgi:predicted CXXCH cytochrome family protein